MLVYLVGGAVRDELLDRKVHEKDYVVVNETPQAMLKRGFKQVGKDFPVFLHPKTHEEYALARKERKTEKGHHGFALDIENVTLEEDLLRRDLTINAIAKDLNGGFIDPFNGESDIKKKVLRHVSPAFVEDPLRIFRVARFQAMLPEFSIHPNTLTLMTQLCNNKEEILSLPKERIWKEVEKASHHTGFYLFWKTLNECKGLTPLGLTIDPLFLRAIETSQSSDTFKLISGLWSHQNPKSFLALNPPTDVADAIKLVASERKTILQPPQNAEALLKTLQRLDPFRRKDRAIRLLETLEDAALIRYWKKLIDTVINVDISNIIKQDDKKAIAQGIADARIKAIKHLFENK